jgi:predicted transcriptional regulator of viral defense system
VRQRHPDAAVADLARRQDGVVARRQLFELGLGRGAIESRLRAGRLHLIHRGVYAVGHVFVSQYGRWLAAVLAVGPGAFLSHLSAAALWRFWVGRRALIDVTIAAGSRRGPRRVRVHRTTALAPDQTRTHFGIPVTSVNRTPLDLSLTLGGRALERAFDEADRLAIIDFDELGRICAAAAGNPGTPG